MQANNATTLPKCLHFLALAGLILSVLFATPALPASAGGMSGAPDALVPGIDLDAGYISRTPRYDWDSTKPWPSPGEIVTFTAHVINKGASPAGSFSYEWRMDGRVIKSGTATAGLPAGGKLNPTLAWAWKSGRHTLIFKVDSKSQVTETYENNNQIKDFTDALSVGFWVETSVYNKFNKNPNGMGTYSWEDWAQYQIMAYNDLLARSKYPRAPYGGLTRLRLDKVTIAPNGTLYALNSQHAPLEKQTDVQWGFTIDDYLNCPLEQCYGISSSLLHELGHYLFGRVDLYGLDVQGGDVRVRDAQGRLIAGTPALPYIAWDVVHYNSRVSDLMSNADRRPEEASPADIWLETTFAKQRFFSDHTIYSLNRDWPAGSRAHRGWTYIYNIPAQSSLQVLDNNDQPIRGVKVYIYQAVGGNGTSGAYSQLFDNVPDITGTTNAQGLVSLGDRPFGHLENYWGMTGGDILVKMVHPTGKVRYVWAEVVDFNLAYWRGRTTAYTHVVHFPEGPKRLRLSRSQVDFLSLDGSNPIPQQINASLLGEGVDNALYVSQPGASWLKVIPFSDNPTTQFTAGPVTFYVNTAGLPAGTYTTQVEIGVGLGAADSPQTVTITLTVAQKQRTAFASAGAEDGWIRESTEASGQGGAAASASALLLNGDSAEDQQYRSILSFDTSSLPDNAVITSATLKIKAAGLPAGTNPFTTHGKLLLDLRKGCFSGNCALEVTDFQAAPNVSAIASIPGSPAAGWYSSALPASALLRINPAGSTQFRLRFALDDNDDLGTDYMKFYSGDTLTPADRPQLIVQYYVP